MNKTLIPMITTKNYFERVKEIKTASLPAKLKEGYSFVKEVTENHSTWEYYNSDTDIKATVDEYLANLSAHLSVGNTPAGKQAATKKKPAIPKKTPAPKPATDSASEKQAREIAKNYIRPYVQNGATVDSLKKSVMGSSNSDYSVQIKGGKIHVDKAGGKKVDFAFPMQSVYNEILEEQPTPKPAKPARTPRAKKEQQPAPAKPAGVRVSNKDGKPVERVDEAVRFIKRFVLLHGKVKTQSQVLNFINSLQRAILEKRIRKTSPYSREIEHIQDGLVNLYNRMGPQITVKLKDSTLEDMLPIAGSEKVRLSTAYMKRYVGIQGKNITKEKATHLYNLIGTAINKGKITGNDPYMKRMKRVLSSLRSFSTKAKKGDTLHIHEAVLNGIQEALDGCACCETPNGKKKDVLQGLDQVSPDVQLKNTMINSMDFVEQHFDTLGFMGKWLELIGDPAEGFTTMVFGPPKFGKSYFCIEMAGYLARHHGNTLYVAKEEKLHQTLRKKLVDKNAQHPALTLSDYLPDDLSGFQFIFLDSVSKLELSPVDLEHLEAENPGKSFIYVFHTTKNGKFRGANTFQHDVDVVIEVPEKGKVVQMGRFNQGGEMEIFE